MGPDKSFGIGKADKCEPLKIADICERYRKELHDFTNSLPGVIAGNEVPTRRSDLVKWMGGFKRAAHHLRLAHNEIEFAGANLQQGEGLPDAKSINPSPTSVLERLREVTRNVHAYANPTHDDTLMVEAADTIERQDALLDEIGAHLLRFRGHRAGSHTEQVINDLRHVLGRR